MSGDPFSSFVRKIREITKKGKTLTDEEKAELLDTINSFFYQSPDGKHISEFQIFWKEKAEDVMGFEVDKSRCKKIASKLEDLHEKVESKGRKITIQEDTSGLSEMQIANARYFTAAQDWGFTFRSSPYEIARKKPEVFEPKNIIKNHPKPADEMLDALGAKSQREGKRRPYHKNLAELLDRKFDGDAGNIPEYCDWDYHKIKAVLVEKPENVGYSKKKLDMFLRDMADLLGWKYKNSEFIDIPSDFNTMKVALRTGILKTNIPLLASYMDVYCYQYSASDKWTRKAWREVWKQWRKIPENHCPPAPALFDIIIFQLGKTCCNSVLFKCQECGKEFVSSPRKQKCIECSSHSLIKISKPPCFENPNFRKCHKGSCKLRDDIVGYCNERCFLVGACEQNKLNAPRSISKRGGTGWEDGMTDEGGGGGITS